MGRLSPFPIPQPAETPVPAPRPTLLSTERRGVYVIEGKATENGRVELIENGLECGHYTEIRLKFESENSEEREALLQGRIVLAYYDKFDEYTEVSVELVDEEEVILREPVRFIGTPSADTNGPGIFTITGTQDEPLWTGVPDLADKVK